MCQAWQCLLALNRWRLGCPSLERSQCCSRNVSSYLSPVSEKWTSWLIRAGITLDWCSSWVLPEIMLVNCFLVTKCYALSGGEKKKKTALNLKFLLLKVHGSSFFGILYYIWWASLVAQTAKNQPAIQETWVLSLGRDDPLEKRMTTHSSTLAWRIPWTEEPGRLQFMGSQRAGRDWEIFTFTLSFIIYMMPGTQHPWSFYIAPTTFYIT